ncbi:MAG: SxtJ family membrane protein [Gemmatimonadota bacterium]
MADGNPTRLSAAAGRKFGTTVGVAFIAIGLLLVWRSHPIRATVALSLGASLAVAGLLIPTMLGPVERAWMGFAHALSKVTTPIFMSIVYFLVMTPIGIIRRRVSPSPILRTARDASRWQAHPASDAVRERMERQF